MKEPIPLSIKEGKSIGHFIVQRPEQLQIFKELYMVKESLW